MSSRPSVADSVVKVLRAAGTPRPAWTCEDVLGARSELALRVGVDRGGRPGRRRPGRRRSRSPPPARPDAGMAQRRRTGRPRGRTSPRGAGRGRSRRAGSSSRTVRQSVRRAAQSGRGRSTRRPVSWAGSGTVRSSVGKTWTTRVAAAAVGAAAAGGTARTGSARAGTASSAREGRAPRHRGATGTERDGARRVLLGGGPRSYRTVTRVTSARVSARRRPGPARPARPSRRRCGRRPAR